MGQKISDVNKIDGLGQGDKDRYNQEAEIEQDYKLLLLGAREAGKTTIYKQLRLKFCEGASDSLSREQFSIYQVFLGHLDSLFNVLIKFYGTTGDATVDRDMNPWDAVNKLREKLMVSGRFTEKGIDIISRIWESKNAQEIWKRRNEFQLSESLDYFCQRDTLNRMKDIDFEPIPQDYIQYQMRTTGIAPVNLNIKGKSIQVVDTGGHRFERNKWPLRCDGVSAIMFVVALDQFDQGLWENHSMNRWKDTLSFLAKTVNISRYETTPFILMLNRVELLKKKLAAKEREKVNLDDYFPELGLGTNYEEVVPQVLDYMEQQLVENLSPSQPYLVQYVNAVDIEAFPQWFTTCSEWLENVW